MKHQVANAKTPPTAGSAPTISRKIRTQAKASQTPFEETQQQNNASQTGTCWSGPSNRNLPKPNNHPKRVARPACPRSAAFPRRSAKRRQKYPVANQTQAKRGHAGLAQATEIFPNPTIALSEWPDQRVPRSAAITRIPDSSLTTPNRNQPLTTSTHNHSPELTFWLTSMRS